MLRIVVLVATKSEDIEVVTPVDLWRRAGIFVRLISIEKKKNVLLAHGNKISCDEILAKENLTKYNAIYLPGGMGFTKFNDTDAPKLIDMLSRYGRNPKYWFLAACAAPSVYGEMGLLEGVKATCYPGYEKSFKDTYVSNKNVVADKNFITANSPSAMIDFALLVIEKLVSKAKADEIAKQILYK